MFDVWVDMKSYVGFSARDSSLLHDFRPLARPHFPRIVAEFYERITHHPAAHAVLTGGHTQIERLQRTLAEWMDSGLAGPHDAAFFARRSEIGRRHVEIGLPQQYMFTAMNLIRTAFHDVAEEELGTDRERVRAIHRALDRLFDLELAVMLQTYEEDSVDLVRKRERAAAMREGKVQLDILVDTMQALLLVLDGQGVVVQANPALATAAGVPSEQLVSVQWLDEFVHPQDRDRFLSLLEALDEGPVTATHESRILRRNGTDPPETRWIQWQAACAIIKNGDRRHCLSGLDVTEVRKLKHEAQVSEKLAAVGTLTAGLAHEIRNPLNGANLQLELLKRRLVGVPGNERMQEIVSAVREELSRLSRIVEDFLKFARPTDMVRDHFDIAELVRRIVAQETEKTLPRSIWVELEVPAEPVDFVGDPHKLEQTLSNLVRNAIEAVSHEGRITVRLHATTEAIEIEIVDNGCGIPPDDVARVFDPFFSTKSMGTGLGMTISHSFIELHDGRISVQSPPSGGTRGTSVSVQLPRNINAS